MDLDRVQTPKVVKKRIPGMLAQPHKMCSIAWVPNNPSRWTDAFMLDSGMTMAVTPESPYFYQDALNDKIVHEILVPQMFRRWFLNRE